MTDIGWVELLVIIAGIAILLLVPKRLLRVMRRLRRWVRHFRGGSKAAGDESGEAGTGPSASDRDE